jgi:hypothetical protein
MDHAKCGYDKVKDLAETHEQCDLAYLIKDNRQFIMCLHDNVYPKGSKCLIYPGHLYLDTFILPYGGHDGASQ